MVYKYHLSIKRSLSRQSTFCIKVSDINRRMDLKLLSLYVVVFCVAHVCLAIDFEYENKTCSYFEGRKPGKGPRTLHIFCSHPEHAHESMECVYRGNPHHCKWYNKKGNQPIFYACLVLELIHDKSLCTADSVACSSHCQDIDFDLHESGKQANEDVVFIKPEEDLPIKEIDLKFRPYV